MGYRSEVIIALSPEKYTELFLLGEAPKVLEGADEEIKTEHGVYWRFSSIKWYTGYTQVDQFMAYLETLSDEDYCFVRVGEDHDDVVTLGDSGRYEIWPETYISCSCI